MKKFNKVVLGLLCAMLMTGCGASEGGEASKNDIPQGLTGSYAGKDSWGYQQVFVFYDGTYVWYNEEIDIENVFEVGSYELKDDSTIVCYSIDGESFEYDMKYDNCTSSSASSVGLIPRNNARREFTAHIYPPTDCISLNCIVSTLTKHSSIIIPLS